METLAQTLQRSVRTVQRHLHLLQELGLIEFVQRRRHKGRFSSYLYRVLHICQTTGHREPVARTRSNKRRTKRTTNTPYSPPKEAFNWWFGKERNLEAEAEYRRQQEAEQAEAARRRRDGYEWLFT